VICDRSDEWFVRFKCAASKGSPAALGRLDPVSGETPFAADTKMTILNCKEKSVHLQDPVSVEEMHDVRHVAQSKFNPWSQAMSFKTRRIQFGIFLFDASTFWECWHERIIG